MPGGQKIFDHYIDANMHRLEDYALHNPREFALLGQRLCDSAFQELRKANNLDSLLYAIIKRHGLNRNLEYGLFVQSVEVAFQRDKFIPLFRPASREPYGARIGGTL